MISAREAAVLIDAIRAVLGLAPLHPRPRLSSLRIYPWRQVDMLGGQVLRRRS